MQDPIRIWRVPGMVFGPHELETGLEAMTPAVLAGIQRAGFTGVWLMVRLRDVTTTAVFPELGTEAERSQNDLRELTSRCRQAGLKLYLHLNEPRGFAADAPFWQTHPDVRGAASLSVNDKALYGWPDSCAMCTSEPRTLMWLEQACTDIFRNVPQLGGVECITTSEHTSHCYSHFDVCGSGIGEHHGQKPDDILDCSPCRERRPTDILREVLLAIEQGVHAVSPSADVIAWTWSWDMCAPSPQADLIESLPPAIIIMPDNERGGELEWNGHKQRVDEYSLNYIGPSPRAREQIKTARQSGKRAMIRIQVNHTVEFATAPNWPLIANLYRKLANLRALGVSDVMAAWNFGNNPDTLNVFALSRFLRQPEWRDENTFLETVACEYFGLADGRAAAKCWWSFGEAVKPYPFGFGILYFSPFNLACAYPLPNHEARTESMEVWCFETRGRQGDRLEQSVEPYGIAEIVERLGRMYKLWHAATAEYEVAVANATERSHADHELNVVRFFGHLVHSAWVLFSWFGWRYYPATVPSLDVESMRQRLRSELQNLDQAATLLERDSRLGFYEEDRKFYVTPALVRAKRMSDAELLETL